jgi:hypothetical protein
MLTVDSFSFLIDQTKPKTGGLSYMKTLTLTALMLFTVVGHSFAGACGGSGTDADSAQINQSDSSDNKTADFRSGD